MEKEQTKFDVLLDKKEGAAVRGFTSGYELMAASFYRTGSTGVADSVQAVQDAGLLQVPTYLHVHGCAFAGKGESAWNNHNDTLGERWTVQVPANKFSGIESGLYVVDVQNAGWFMPQHQWMKTQIADKLLKERAFAIGNDAKNMLFGEKKLYQWGGKELKQVPVQLFTSYGAFLEWSKNFNPVDMPIYAVMRTAEEARMNPSGQNPINKQHKNSDLIVVSGSKAQLDAMLDKLASFDWEQFHSYHDGYTSVDSGLVVALNGFGGVDCRDSVFINPDADYGRSCGVAPEALAEVRRTALDDKIIGIITSYNLRT